jgi:hypothetical protein
VSASHPYCSKSRHTKSAQEYDCRTELHQDSMRHDGGFSLRLSTLNGVGWWRSAVGIRYHYKRRWRSVTSTSWPVPDQRYQAWACMSLAGKRTHARLALKAPSGRKPSCAHVSTQNTRNQSTTPSASPHAGRTISKASFLTQALDENTSATTLNKDYQTQTDKTKLSRAGLNAIGATIRDL